MFCCFYGVLRYVPAAKAGAPDVPSVRPKFTRIPRNKTATSSSHRISSVPPSPSENLFPCWLNIESSAYACVRACVSLRGRLNSPLPRPPLPREMMGLCPTPVPILPPPLVGNSLSPVFSSLTLVPELQESFFVLLCTIFYTPHTNRVCDNRLFAHLNNKSELYVGRGT